MNNIDNNKINDDKNNNHDNGNNNITIESDEN